MNDRFTSQYVQRDRRYKNNLWGIFDSKYSEYLVYGTKGEMNKIAKGLNEANRGD